MLDSGRVFEVIKGIESCGRKLTRAAGSLWQTLPSAFLGVFFSGSSVLILILGLIFPHFPPLTQFLCVEGLGLVFLFPAL
jgi:hypothetical protein